MMRNYLIVANGTSGGEELNELIHNRMAEGPCRFHVIVPAPGPGGDDTLDTAKSTLALELARSRRPRRRGRRRNRRP